MADILRSNIDYLSHNLTNLNEVLCRLLQIGIISQNEKDNIQLPTKTPYDQNSETWTLLIRKDWTTVKEKVIEILKGTCNNHCANTLEGKQKSEVDISPVPKTHLLQKWWPFPKYLVKSFFERKIDNKLLIENIFDILKGDKNRTAAISQKVTVSGFGGVGKTLTSKWFAIRYADNYDHIIWIDSEKEKLMTSFKALAKKLNVEGWTELTVEYLAHECYDKLSQLNCLFIFDNAECFAGSNGVRDVLPIGYDKFNVIITSRNKEWGNSNGYGPISCFLINVFETSESINFLKQNLNYQNEEHLLGELSAILGNLPLALQIAVATLNKRKMAIKAYLKLMKKTPESLNIVVFDDYEKSIDQTMTVSLQQIKNNENVYCLPYNILTVSAYLQSENIPLTFFEAIEDVETWEVDAAVEILDQYSLIQLHVQKIGDEDVKFMSVHRLLQHVIRKKLAPTESLEILRKILRTDGFLPYKEATYRYAQNYDEFKVDHFSALQSHAFQKKDLKRLLAGEQDSSALKKKKN